LCSKVTDAFVDDEGLRKAARGSERWYEACQILQYISSEFAIKTTTNTKIDQKFTRNLSLRASRRCFSITRWEALSSAVNDRIRFLAFLLLSLLVGRLPDKLPDAVKVVAMIID
jgi:hypothetical protein